MEYFNKDAAGLTDLIEQALSATDELPRGTRVAQYRDTGILTRNDGLVVRLPDGSEFQITVVQSKTA